MTALPTMADTSAPIAPGIYPLTELGLQTLRALERIASRPLGRVPGSFRNDEVPFDG